MLGKGVEQDFEKAVKWYRRAAEFGDVNAQDNLGWCYEKGVGVEQDWEEAIVWYRKAAEQGLAHAQCNLGWCYEYSKGEGRDWKTVRLFRNAVKQGDTAVQCLSWFHMIGKGNEQDWEEAAKWFFKAAEQGYADAQCKLGEYYEVGKGVKQDKVEAVKWYRKAAEQGHVEAQINLMSLYELEEDWEEAVKWYHKASELGDAEAQYKLGVCYGSGKGVKQDYGEAMKWYCKAAEQGNADAQLYLGWRCYEIDHHYEEAVKWYSKAAGQRYAEAQYMLGVCYGSGKGVEQDWKEAVKWYRKAAEQGNADAQCCLGACYKNGKGVEQDREEAVKWYRMAAEQGNAGAQCCLGVCYENGEGVDQDWEEALKWYRKAAEQGILVTDIIWKLVEKIRIKKIVNTAKHYLFFNIEKTGVPNAPTQSWPRLVRLAWILTDEEGNPLSQGNEIVKPEGFVIPADAARVHGITTEKAMQMGKPLREVIDLFLQDAGKAQCIVGHNISVDQEIVGAELNRLGITDTISTAKSICTKKVGTDFCKIPGYFGYEWPKLQELHHKLFGCDFEDAHDAMADITATVKCFFEMRRRGLI